MNLAAIAILFVLAPASPQCDRVIADMGSDQWEVREAASSAAERLGTKHYLQFELAAGTHADTEVRRRCQVVTRHAAETELAKLGPLPWITVYGCNQPQVPEHHNDYLRLALTANGYVAESWAVATELYCQDRVRLLLAMGLDTTSLKAELQKMREAEAAWKESVRWRPPPS